MKHQQIDYRRVLQRRFELTGAILSFRSFCPLAFRAALAHQLEKNSMQMKCLRLVVVLPLLALIAVPAQAARTEKMYTPEPIQVPAGKSTEAIKQAVRKALFDRDWEIREIGPGHLQGKHTKVGKKESYTAIVDVKFDAKTVRISYKGSENLNYNKEDGSIHKTYNGWIRYLEKNIRANLGSY